MRLDEGAIRTATAYTRERPALRSALLAWQEITQPIHLYIVMTAVCLWVWLARRRTTLAWWAFVTMMLGWNLALVLKYVVQRARPVVDDPCHTPRLLLPPPVTPPTPPSWPPSSCSSAGRSCAAVAW